MEVFFYETATKVANLQQSTFNKITNESEILDVVAHYTTQLQYCAEKKEELTSNGLLEINTET